MLSPYSCDTSSFQVLMVQFSLYPVRVIPFNFSKLLTRTYPLLVISTNLPNRPRSTEPPNFRYFSSVPKQNTSYPTVIFLSPSLKHTRLTTKSLEWGDYTNTHPVTTYLRPFVHYIGLHLTPVPSTSYLSRFCINPLS